MNEAQRSEESRSTAKLELGYWCVVCGRYLPEDEGVIVHDNLTHPEHMTFDEEENPQ